jgi:type IV pilus assembly protein PilB
VTSSPIPFSEDDVIAIKGSGLFTALDEEDLQKIITKLVKRRYPAEISIFAEGPAPRDAVFIVKEGGIELKKRWNGLGGQTGRLILRDGASFGASCGETGQMRRTSAVTTETTDVFVLSSEDYQVLIRESDAISAAMAQFTNKIDIGVKKDNGVVALKRAEAGSDVLNRLPEQVIMASKLLPVILLDDTLILAMVNTNDLPAIDAVKKYFKDVIIQPALLDEEDFRVFMKNVYPGLRRKQARGGRLGVEEKISDFQISGHDVIGQGHTRRDTQGDVYAQDAEKEAGSATVIQHCDNIIALAMNRRASDIHLEPTGKGLRFRLRVDGVLKDEQGLPAHLFSPLVNRFKVLSRLDITERRVPQDGRFSLKAHGRNIDFRMSTIPTKYGEKVVIRILDKEAQVFGLNRLITQKATLSIIRQMIQKPYGIIFVTGPTGSGKTTTLYSALSELNVPGVNICTVEDPIEYDLPGINQVEINPDIGLDFARVLRAFLRQDPDIILVGETRDRETAKTAVEAALTGHLVFTTLHTNDAPSAFIRLSEMGIEPFLLSTSVVGIVAQRLVRRICPDCSESYEADESLARYLGIKPGTTVYRGKGCDTCSGAGYRGRAGVFEVLTVSDEVKYLIARRASAEEIRAKAVSNGMKTLKDYALALLKEGQTTVDEVVKTVIVGE